MEFFLIKHRCDALSAAVCTGGIQSLNGGNEVEALQHVVCRRMNRIRTCSLLSAPCFVPHLVECNLSTTNLL